MLLKWGICGAGSISADFANCLSLLSDQQYRVTAVASTKLEKAQSFIEENKLKYAKACGSYNQLFLSQDVDIVYVGVLNHMHENVVLNALNAGKHVLCEKPLGLNTNQVKRMIASAKRNNRFLMEAYWTKMFPAYMEAKKLIENGAIGKVQMLLADSSAIRLKPNKLELELGGGALMAIGCYLAMMAVDIFKMNPTSIKVYGYKRHDLTSSDVDDTACIILRFPGDQMAQLTYSSSVATPRTASIGGTKGHIQLSDVVWCPTKLSLSTTSDGKRFEKENKEFPAPDKQGLSFKHPQNPTGLVYEAIHVRECLLKGLIESPIMSWDDSVRVAKVSDEIRLQIGVTYPDEGTLNNHLFH